MAVRNAMEIFSLLNKSNCRECGEKTCLAFAGAVFTGRSTIERCPHLSPEDKVRLMGDSPEKRSGQDGDDATLAELLDRQKDMDLDDAARRCGGRVVGDRVVVKVLGKDFGVDRQGRFFSDIHINAWVSVPFLVAMHHGKGREPVGRWISYREVDGGRERYGLFRQRCEEDLRKIADSWPDLFKDMVETFQGREVESRFQADISVVLRPLPLVPVMICYWRPDEGLESTLNIYFDETVNDNLGNDGIYSLTAGLATMFGKLALRHGC